MINRYFKSLYQRTMKEAYNLAHEEIVSAVKNGGDFLDCGANTGASFRKLSARTTLQAENYYGLEWNPELVKSAQQNNLNIAQADLNNKFPFDDDHFVCIYGLSVLEHLLNGCHYIQECYRTLEPDGKLILLTPNISTYFTAILILAGKMPSSGPHPDSTLLLNSEEITKVSADNIIRDVESDTPVHRHLVVFSYRVLKKYLNLIGFSNVRGYGFGLYPFPNFVQPVLEKIDPWHCHQMVFIAQK